MKVRESGTEQRTSTWVGGGCCGVTETMEKDQREVESYSGEVSQGEGPAEAGPAQTPGK